MPVYSLWVNGSGSEREPFTEDELRAVLDRVGSELWGQEGSPARVIKGQLSVPDDRAKGPLGGVYFIEALDEDAAHAWGSRLEELVGLPVHVMLYRETWA
jgi:hypothetical protein